MEELFYRALVAAAVTALPLFLLLFPARRWLERRYAPQVRWTLWRGMALLLLLGLCFAGVAATPATVVRAPSYQIPVSVQGGGGERETPAPVQTMAAAGETAMESPDTPTPSRPGQIPLEGVFSMSLVTLLSWLWLGGALLVLGRQLAGYGMARRRLLAAAVPDPCLECCAPRVRLLRLPGLPSPVTMGVLRPVVFLPEGETEPLALRHELTHIARRDLLFKTLLLLACALYWFDPLVWRMARVADLDMEAACDAQVTRGMTSAEKRAYGELLLASAQRQASLPLSSRFGGSKGQMKARLTQLFRPGRRSWGLVAVLLTAACLGTCLVACQSGTASAGGEEDPSGQPQTETSTPSETPSETPAVSPAITPSPQPLPSPEPTAGSAARAAYAGVLRNLLENLVLPDGTQLTRDDVYAENLSPNTFAVADVDGDGQEELVVYFSTTYMAGMQGTILGYDETRGETCLELIEFPSFTFYSNGYLKAYASHNQTFGEMWPYTLYQYRPETDTYEPVCMVYSSDLAIMEDAGIEGDYPREVDRSGAGTVYYVDGAPMDQADYQAWEAGWMGDAWELPLEEWSLTADHVAALAG